MNQYILWIVLLVGLVWFMIVRPQRNARRRASALESSLEVGDEVVTIGGLYGYIVSIDDREVELDVAEGVTLRFARRAVAGKVPVEDAEDEAGDDADELEDDGEPTTGDEPVDGVPSDETPVEEPVVETAPTADESSGR
jgi:preprotein translocase subunit YajC